jgi:hypothetical protein
MAKHLVASRVLYIFHGLISLKNHDNIFSRTYWLKGKIFQWNNFNDRSERKKSVFSFWLYFIYEGEEKRSADSKGMAAEKNVDNEKNTKFIALLKTEYETQCHYDDSGNGCCSWKRGALGKWAELAGRANPEHRLSTAHYCEQGL